MLSVSGCALCITNITFTLDRYINKPYDEGNNNQTDQHTQRSMIEARYCEGGDVTAEIKYEVAQCKAEMCRKTSCAK